MTWSRTTNGSTPPHVSKRVKAKSSPTPAAHLAHQTPPPPPPPPPTAVLCWFRRRRHEAGGTICCAFSGNGCSIEPELCFCFVCFFTSTDSSDVSVQIRREDAAESATATPHGQTASEPYVQVTIWKRRTCKRPFLNSLSSSCATFYTTSTEQKQKREASSSNFLVGNVSLSPSAGLAFKIRARCALHSFACVDVRINVCDIIMYFGFICSRRAGYHLLYLLFFWYLFFLSPK